MALSSNRLYTFLTLLLGVALVGVWEAAVHFEAISNLILPKPSAILNATWSGFKNGTLYAPILSTLGATLGGFGVAVGFSLVVGILIALNQKIEAVLMPYIVAFQATPVIAIAPIVLLWIGYGQVGKIFISASVAFFPILMNVVSGLRLRNESELDLFRVFGASKWQTFLRLRLPGALPSVFTGLNIGIVLALLGAVVGEFVGSKGGLGYYLLGQRALFNLPAVFSAVMILAVMGIILKWLMTKLEYKVVFWARDLSEA